MCRHKCYVRSQKTDGAKKLNVNELLKRDGGGGGGWGVGVGGGESEAE